MLHCRPAAATTIGLPECARSAAARQPTDIGDGNAVHTAGRAYGSTCAYLATDYPLADNSAAGNDDGRAGAPRTRRTDADNYPRAVKIVATATSAARPRSMHLLCGLVRRAFRRSLPRARQGFFLVSYAAAGAALRQRHTLTGYDDESRTEQSCHDPMSGGAFHEDRSSDYLGLLFCRPDPSAHTASTTRQEPPALPHSSSATSLAFWTFSR